MSVNPTLTVKRPKKVTESREYAGMVRRCLRALGRRVADKDVEALVYLLDLERDMISAQRSAVEGLRDAGYSWAEIAAPLGITRQAAHQRWGGGRA